MIQIYCSNCGHLFAQNANFCAFCGAAAHGKASSVYNHVQHLQSAAVTPPALHTTAPKPEQKNLAAKVEREHVSPIAQLIFIVSYMRTSGIILLLGFAALIFEPILALCIIAVYLAALALTAQLAWNNYRFSIDTTHFSKQHGILHKSSVTVPFDQIQNVNITRSLIDQLLGLARIDIETAGNSLSTNREVIGGSTSRAEAHLVGIKLARAKEIHDILLQKVAATQS